jgi:hypothetical protein
MCYKNSIIWHVMLMNLKALRWFDRSMALKGEPKTAPKGALFCYLSTGIPGHMRFFGDIRHILGSR